MPVVKSPKLLAAFAIVFSASLSTPSDVQANRYIKEDFACNSLWHIRNNIYADKGYCFKTKRGKAEYPDSCFPPYGKLTRAEKKEVNLVKKAERAKGC